MLACRRSCRTTRRDHSRRRRSTKGRYRIERTVSASTGRCRRRAHCHRSRRRRCRHCRRYRRCPRCPRRSRRWDPPPPPAAPLAPPSPVAPASSRASDPPHPSASNAAVAAIAIVIAFRIVTRRSAAAGSRARRAADSRAGAAELTGVAGNGGAPIADCGAARKDHARARLSPGAFGRPRAQLEGRTGSGGAGGRRATVGSDCGAGRSDHRCSSRCWSMRALRRCRSLWPRTSLATIPKCSSPA